MKKTVTFIIQNLEGGGAERILINKLKYLNRKIFNIRLFVIDKRGIYFNEIPKDVKVSYYNDEEKSSSKSNILQKIISKVSYEFEIFKITKKAIDFSRGSDLVVGYLEFQSSYVAAMVGRKLGIPTVTWIHIALEKHFPKGIRYFKHYLWSNWTYKVVNKVFVVSEEAKFSAISKFPQLRDKIKVQYNPNNIEEILNLSKQSISDFNNSSDYIKILGIGRLTPQKGFDILIKAQKILKDKGVRSKLVILGEGPDCRKLEELIKELNLQNDVELLGFKSNPYPYLKNADFFVLSSRYEGLPTVLIEALALGKPVISTDCPSGPKEIIEHGVSGILVPVEDPMSIAKAINTLINNVDLTKKLIEQAKIRSKDFSHKLIMPEIEKDFIEIIKINSKR